MTGDVRQRIESAARSIWGIGWVPDRVVSAPGRIELIGNHLDYNGGPVLAAAIDRRIWIASREVRSRDISAIFADMPVEESPARVVAEGTVMPMTEGVHPRNFLIGAIEALDARGVPRRLGLELVVSGNLPHGVGISSSAALCVGLVTTLASEPGALDPLTVVNLARDAENRTGSPCGAMDQSASVFGDAIWFDGANGSVQPLQTALGEHAFLLADSNVVRSLATSSYPTRVNESRKALGLLQEGGWLGLQSLAEFPEDDLAAAEHTLNRSGDPALFLRLRHVVTERARVERAAGALDARDWAQFGALMTGSGRSSALDYEISHPVVEELVGRCLEAHGVLGARMMGGGEGGAVLSLIRATEREAIVAHLERTFYAQAGGPSAAESARVCSIDRGLAIDDGWE